MTDKAKLEGRAHRLKRWREIKALVQHGRDRKALQRYDCAIDDAHDCGYVEGHEDQMQMRILDAKERAR